MRQVRYRAVITLDPETEGRASRRPRHSGLPAPMLGPQYFSHTHDLMVRASSLRRPERQRSFAAELCWDDGVPLNPGDRHVVTITVLDDDAPAFLGAGQRFTLWDGAEVGHGTISRQVFTQYGPC